MTENPSTSAAPVRRRDLHRRRSRFSSGVSSFGGTSNIGGAPSHHDAQHLPRRREAPEAASPYAGPPESAENHSTPSRAELSPRRAAMAAEARADRRSPRRKAMAREALSTGQSSVSALSAGPRGSDGALLRSVRRQRVTTMSTLAAVSLAGATTAVALLGSFGGSSEVSVDRAAVSEPGAISPEAVDAQVSDDDGQTSIAIGAPSAKQQNAEASERSISKSVLPGCDPKQDFDQQADNGELPAE